MRRKGRWLIGALVLIAVAVTAALLWPKSAPARHGPLLDESIQFTTEVLPLPTPTFEGDHWVDLNFNGDFTSLMEGSRVVLLGEVIEALYIEPWYSYCYKVKVITDYYGNIDYRGVEPGCIWVFWPAVPLWTEEGTPFLMEGGRYFFFLRQNHDLSCRQMIYSSATEFAPRLTDEGMVFPTWFRDRIELGDPPFGITEDADLDRMIRDYVQGLSREEVPHLRVIPEMHSYEEAYHYALSVQLIEVTDWQERPWGAAVVYYDILEDLKTVPPDPDAASKGFDIYAEPPTRGSERVPEDLTLEIGKRYLLFKGQDPRYPYRSIRILSMDYGFLPEDDPLFETICAELEYSPSLP